MSSTAVELAIELGTEPISKKHFLPLIRELASISNEIEETYQTAEFNKRICGVMLGRIQVIEKIAKNLENREENDKIFSKKNYIILQSLVNFIAQIRKFMQDISQLKGFAKYIQIKNIEKAFIELNNEFDSIVQFLNSSLKVPNSVAPATIVSIGVEAASNVEVPFAKFLPLIEEMNKI